MKRANKARCWEFLGLSENRLDWITPIIVPKSESLLNIGCLDGKEALALSFLFSPREIIVCDIEPQGGLRLEKELSDLSSMDLNCWTEKPTFSFVQWDITKQSPFPQQKLFDCIYCDNVLYNIYADNGESELSNVIGKLSQLIASDGFIVLVEPKIGKNPAPRQEEKDSSHETENGLSWLREFIPQVVLEGETIDITPILKGNGLSIVHHDAERARYVGRK